jgi:sterol desaturase/sphingolipid hydroxylase (fatty acid hydroxylase superfamily)
MNGVVTILGNTAILFAILIVVFRLIDLLRPRDERLPIFRKNRATDYAYWIFGPLVTENLSKIAAFAALAPISLLAFGKVDTNLIMHGFGPASRLPVWLQIVLITIIGDFSSYWMHRAFHRGRLWNFHAIHHSIVDLDWLSSLRVHPLNDALMRIAGTLPVVALGFAPAAYAGVVVFFGLFAILVHANVDWDWGPLRTVFVSPRFHRWHHTSEAEGRDKNFAGFLPVWDILFGTYYMPDGKLPRVFGTATPVPSGLWGQLLFPFRHSAITPRVPVPRVMRSRSTS